MITSVNAQGTKLWVGPPPATPWMTCGEAITALRGMPLINCPQSIGEVSETRQVQEYKCLSSNESAKALGAVSRSSFDVGVLLNPEDRAGQQLLRQAFRDNTNVVMGIEIDGAMLYFEAGVSGMGTTIEQDAAIITKFSIEVSSDIMECSTSNLVSYPVVNNGVSLVNNGVPVVNTH